MDSLTQEQLAPFQLGLKYVLSQFQRAYQFRLHTVFVGNKSFGTEGTNANPQVALTLHFGNYVLERGLV